MLSENIEKLFCCPVCKSKIERSEEQFLCTAYECGKQYPIIDGIPVLINEDSSIFSISDFVSRGKTTLNLRTSQGIRKLFAQTMPSIGKNLSGAENYQKLVELLAEQTSNPKVLVLGGGIVGSGMEPLLEAKYIDLIETDVSFGPRTNLICDAHDIPFKDNSFDAVVVQAVLEHVADPYRCVEEIHRVLTNQGLVYADTPFMQQVHMGRYDFTRFTLLGHRRLFRKFEEVYSGISCGPGMALSWSYQYFLLSFTTSHALRKFIIYFVSMTSFFLKYFDNYLIKKTGATDAASSFYFLGKKSNNILSDRELVKSYKGAF